MSLYHWGMDYTDLWDKGPRCAYHSKYIKNQADRTQEQCIKIIHSKFKRDRDLEWWVKCFYERD